MDCSACTFDRMLHTCYPIGKPIPEVQPAVVETGNYVRLCFKHAKAAQAGVDHEIKFKAVI